MENSKPNAWVMADQIQTLPTKDWQVTIEVQKIIKIDMSPDEKISKKQRLEKMDWISLGIRFQTEDKAEGSSGGGRRLRKGYEEWSLIILIMIDKNTASLLGRIK